MEMTIREILFSLENTVLVLPQVLLRQRISNRDFVFLSLLIELLHIALIRGQIFTNEFAVQVAGGNEVARKIAEDHGFSFQGQIGNLDGFYLFGHHAIQKRSLNVSIHHHGILSQNPSVLWVEQQHVKRRVKRDIHEDHLYKEYPDPLYGAQWFLHGGGKGGFDMNVIPAWTEGYTGKGVVVSILDDGIQTNHPDLEQNYDKNASLDINGNDNDPMPQDNDDNKHGTRCAGEVASVAFNKFCGVGVAYNASIGGTFSLFYFRKENIRFQEAVEMYINNKNVINNEIPFPIARAWTIILDKMKTGNKRKKRVNWEQNIELPSTRVRTPEDESRSKHN